MAPWSKHRRAQILALALGLSGVAPAARIEAAAARQDLLLITVDTLRADALGVNGATRGATPYLDRLAREGVNFSRARASVPLTLPSHASILTGTDPPVHGVRDNAVFSLAPQQLTLAEVLAAAGYETAAFVASFVLDERFGLGQGFAHYDDRAWTAVDRIETVDAERPAEAIVEVFDQWLRTVSREARIFAWLHFYDPHAPYEAPAEYRARYPEDPYVAEVAYTDHAIGRVLDLMSAVSRDESMLVAVVGDHGEGLGDHGEATHSLLLYNSTLHVPMILWGPGLVAAGGSIATLTPTIDLAPTLLELLGIEADLGDGRSLAAWVGSQQSLAATGERFAYSETLYPRNLGWSELRGLENDRYRLILGPDPELFDVVTDPQETRNLIEREPVIYQRLKRQLVDLQRMREPDEKAGAGQLDSDTQDRLRSLGYLSGGRGASQGPPIDPKSKIELWNKIQAGIALQAAGRPREAVAIFEAVLQAEPTMGQLYELVGSAWLDAGEPQRTEAAYHEALERGFESAALHRELGRIHLGRREATAAIRELEIALAIDGQDVKSYHLLGDALRSAGRLEEAEARYRRALELNPDYLWAWNGLGMTLAMTQRDAAALEAFQRATTIASHQAESHFNLAVQLERMGKRSEAVAAYQQFLDLAQDPHLEMRRRQAEEALVRLGQ